MSAEDVIRCPHCGHVLGTLVAGCLIVRHRGREIVCRDLIAVRCEDCGHTWRPQPTAA